MSPLMAQDTGNAARNAALVHKGNGNLALRSGDAAGAVQHYSRALTILPHDHATLSNRSAALLLLGRYADALADALECTKVAPSWPKAHYRLARALIAAGAWEEASFALVSGLQLKRNCQDMTSLAADCRLQGVQLQLAQRAQRSLLAVDLAATRAAGRRAQEVAALTAQLSESLAAPGAWLPGDWQWRPTWLPETLLPDPAQGTPDIIDTHVEPAPTPSTPSPPCRVHSSSSSSSCSSSNDGGRGNDGCGGNDGSGGRGNDGNAPATGKGTGVDQGLPGADVTGLLASYLRVLESLERPGAMLAACLDDARVAAYDTAIQAAIAQLGPGVHVLVHGQCGGLLALLAARAGAAAVTLLEHCPLSHHASALLLAGNQHVTGVANISLEPAPLATCRMPSTTAGKAGVPCAETSTVCTADAPSAQGAFDQGVAHGSGTDPHENRVSGATEQRTHYIKAARPAGLVITDLFDHSVLGAGALTFLRAAASQGLVAAGARVLPEAVHISAQLVSEGRAGIVRGCDMSAVNTAHWYPGPEPVDARNHLPSRVLSEPCPLSSISLQAVLDDAMAAASSGTPLQALALQRCEVPVHVTAAGVWNVTRTWNTFDFGTLGGGTTFCTAGSAAQGSMPSAIGAGASSHATASHTLYPQPAAAGVFQVGDGLRSWPLASWHVEPEAVQPGKQVALKVVVQEAALHVLSAAAAPSRPCHLLLPPWHLRVLHDEPRTAAYETAIRRAVAGKYAELQRKGEERGVNVLIVGAGTGLVTLLTASVLLAVDWDSHRGLVVASRRVDVEHPRAIVALARLDGQSLDDRSSLSPFVAHVWALESSPAVAALCEEVLGSNVAMGVDVLRGSFHELAVNYSTHKPHPVSIPCAPDVLVLENLDDGLLGEGVLRVLNEACASGILTPSTVVVPSAAQIFCQPIELNGVAGTAADADRGSISLAALQPFRCKPDYTSMDLTPDPATKSASQTSTAHGSIMCPAGMWRPLADPAVALELQFTHDHIIAAPSQSQLSMVTHSSGRITSIAFWFDLCLHDRLEAGEAVHLTSAPLNNQPSHSRAWRVATQQLGAAEIAVSAGQVIHVTSSHDTHAMSFAVLNSASSLPNPAESSSTSNVAPVHDFTGDALWSVQKLAAQHLSNYVLRPAAMDPLALRQITSAAVSIAAGETPAAKAGIGRAAAAALAARMFW